MKIYSVVRRGEPDSEYLFQAACPERAADLYMKAVLDEAISVDPEIFVGEDRAQILFVRTMLSPGEGRIGMAEGAIGWDEPVMTQINLSDCPSWQDALARGYDPETGAWDEGPNP